MNNFHKNKGIVIELTALLDVIMIMLFWVMMNMSVKTDKANSEAENKVAQAESQVAYEKEKAKEQIDSILDETNRQIEQFREQAENADSKAYENQMALDRYSQGLIMKINIRFEQNGDVVYVSKGDDLISDFTVNDSDVYENIESAFIQSGSEKDEVILCAVIYDGSQVLNRDFNKVSEAVAQLTEFYGNLYCTYINTSR